MVEKRSDHRYFFGKLIKIAGKGATGDSVNPRAVWRSSLNPVEFAEHKP